MLRVVHCLLIVMQTLLLALLLVVLLLDMLSNVVYFVETCATCHCPEIQQAGDTANNVQYVHQLGRDLCLDPQSILVGCDSAMAVQLTSDPISAARRSTLMLFVIISKRKCTWVTFKSLAFQLETIVQMC
jgi:hypothetical protein